MNFITSFAIFASAMWMDVTAPTPGMLSPQDVVNRKLAPDIEFDSTDLAWLAAPEGVRNRRLDHEPEGELTGRVLHAVRDFNGDGVADLGVFELKGGELKKMHSSYEVHFGRPTSHGGITFATEASTRVDSDGIPFDIVLSDFDDDGQVDISIMVLRPGFFKVIGVLLSSVFRDSISLKLELYRMDDGRYPARPDAVRKVRTIPPLGESGEVAAKFPEISFLDADGDGRTDLLVQSGADEHLFYSGLPRPKLFAGKPQTYSTNGSAE